jgi:tetratricopeptide (TPR) repeat protein
MLRLKFAIGIRPTNAGRLRVSQPPIDIARLTVDGVAALRERDYVRARIVFLDIVTRSGATASAYLGLAFALKALKDFDAYLAALDSALALEPRNTRALLLKGDWLFEHGERRRAGGFYQVALSNQLANPPPDLAQHLTRATNRMAELFADYEAHLRSKLTDAGYNPKTSSKRFSDALEMLMGRKQRDPGPQNPMVFFFPGLAALGFHPRSDTPWMGEIEEASVSTSKQSLRACCAIQRHFHPI